MKKLMLQIGKKQFPLAEHLQIGRSSRNDVKIEDSSVSGFHAAVSTMGTMYAISDLNSKYGTFLNGTRLQPKNNYPLRNGDELYFGTVPVRVVAVEDSGEMSPQKWDSYVQSLRVKAKYNIEKILMSRATGRLLLAKDTDKDMPVLLKVVNEELDENAVAIDEFRRECRLVRNLVSVNHPHFIKILYVETGMGAMPYYVMEYVPGESLDQYLASNKPSKQLAVNIVIQIAQALAFLHGELHILHRDLQPANIWITPKLVAKLFNLSSIKGETSVSLTMVGHRNTSLYMEPQILLEEEHCVQSDIYSLGMILYHMLQGSLPFQNSSEAIAYATSGKNKPQPLEDPLLEQVMSMMIARSRDDRFANYQTVISRLERISSKLEVDLSRTEEIVGDTKKKEQQIDNILAEREQRTLIVLKQLDELGGLDTLLKNGIVGMRQANEKLREENKTLREENYKLRIENDELWKRLSEL